VQSKIERLKIHLNKKVANEFISLNKKMIVFLNILYFKRLFAEKEKRYL